MIGSFIKKHQFLFVAVVLLWIKTYLVYVLSFDMKIENSMQALILLINPVSFFLIVFGIGLFMKERSRNRFILAASTLMTFILIANMMFYTFFNDFLTIPVLFQTNNAGSLGSSFAEVANPLYLLLFVDLFFLYGLYRKSNHSSEKRVSSKERMLYFAAVGIFMLINLGLAEVQRPQLLTRSFDREILVKNIGIFHFHLYDAVLQTKTTAQKALASSDELTEIENYIRANKVAPSEEMTGIAEGRNIIFVSMESTQSFVVNETINGKEITPFLNDFIGESYYFDQFYHQTQQGKTSDSEFLTANSLYPLDRGAVFFTNSSNTYHSMPSVLKEKNYYSATFHANNASFWNRDIMYNAMGVDSFFDIKSYDVQDENSVGWGLKDKEYFEQSVQMMKELPQPFYSYFITLTNHFPFELAEEDRLIDEFDSSSGTLNRFFPTVRYQDEALKFFIEDLKANGLYENSVIVLMGDHYGISENHNKAMAQFLEKDTITPYDTVQLQRVPMLIHIPGVTDQNPKVISDVSGQIDVKPTLLNMVGIDTKDHIHFGNDLFSKERKPFTVLRDGSFITEEAVYTEGSCFDRQTGAEIDSEKGCSPMIEKAQKELTYSDQIIYGDLLRFFDQ
ncbi:LTA synthase family protein [Metabacillus idriensis]|uniref:LTA synthase family protein n=1 Tax=Metabacillus idriensis TaxID=324768 RepID=UPI001CD2BBDF|nr:LTA synthase family protein [Metabacillus idriensis]